MVSKLGKIKLFFWIAALSGALGSFSLGRIYEKRTEQPKEITNFFLQTSSVVRDLKSMGFHAEIPKELQNPEIPPLDPKKIIIIRDENGNVFTEQSLESFLKRHKEASLESAMKRIETLLSAYAKITPKLAEHQKNREFNRALGRKRGAIGGAGLGISAMAAGIAAARALRKRKERRSTRRA